MDSDPQKSRRILEALRREAGVVVDVDEERIKLVMFRIGEGDFAFRGEGVKEILLPQEIFFVPGAPARILGVINVRGDIESVLDLAGVLGYEGVQPSAANRILIAEAGGVRSGVLVSRITDVLDVPASSLKPPLSTMSRETADFVLGEAKYAKGNVTVLDLEKVLGRLSA